MALSRSPFRVGSDPLDASLSLSDVVMTPCSTSRDNPTYLLSSGGEQCIQQPEDWVLSKVILSYCTMWNMPDQVSMLHCRR